MSAPASAGAVTYEANWDEFQTIDWWRAVDVIDVSGYFPLAIRTGRPVQQLTAAGLDRASAFALLRGASTGR